MMSARTVECRRPEVAPVPAGDGRNRIDRAGLATDGSNPDRRKRAGPGWRPTSVTGGGVACR